MATNPYYIEPGGNILPGLSSLQGAVARLGAKKEREAELERQRAVQERVSQMRQGAVDAFRSNDPDVIAEFSIQNPEFSSTLNEMVKFRSDKTKDNYITSAIQAIENPAMLPQLAQQRASFLSSEGLAQEDMQETMAITEQYEQDPEGTITRLRNEVAAIAPQRWKQYRESTQEVGGGTPTPAELVTFEALTMGLAPEEKSRARRIKLGLSPRASETATDKALKAFATETAKLEAKLGVQPKIASAVKAAENEAKAEADEIVKKKSNKTAWDVYSGAMGNLSKSMEGTETGAFVGLIPAVTSDQQIAEGAVAVMAPVLKQMFRASGEGVFTDKDQEMLMKMVPTRTDTPEARIAKISGIDSVVRAKLGVSEQQRETQQPQETMTITSESEYANVPSGTEYIYKGVKYRKK